MNNFMDIFCSPLALIAMPSTNNSVDVTDSVSESLDWNLLKRRETCVILTIKKEIKLKKNTTDFTLKSCCTGACPDQTVADILQTDTRQQEQREKL